jgi:D-glycero-D-manno-heptose 1,7-bisphosphate phosphatase
MSVVFLDRDGVINEFPGVGSYVTGWDGFRFLPGALEGIRLLTEAGHEIFVVSNQGCVAKKLITREGLDDLTARMLGGVERAGGRIHAVHYCVHETKDACDCKKPKTLLFRKALEGKRVDIAHDVTFIGDSREDMEAGKALGCRTVLVLSGRLSEADLPTLGVRPDAVKKNLLEAAQWLATLEKR